MKGSSWAGGRCAVAPGCCGLPGRRHGFLEVEARWERAIPTAASLAPLQSCLTAQGSTARCSPGALREQSLFSGILPFLAALQQITAGRKREETINVLCYRGAGNSAKGFPFLKPTAVLPGGSAPRSAVCPQFRGTPARRQAGRGRCARQPGQEEGQGALAVRASRAATFLQPSCTTPGRSGCVPAPAQDAFLIKGCSEHPVFPLSLSLLGRRMQPAPHPRLRLQAKHSLLR